MIERDMFFDGWHGVVRVLAMATIGYTALLAMLRISRKRSLAKMNVFDFVYIVIVGELLAITIMDERIPLANGVVGVATLILLRVLVSWVTTRSKRAERVINGEPTLVLRRGRFLHRAMRAERITESEILSAVRAEGLSDLEQVEAVVLETNGSLSIVHHRRTMKPSSVLRDVAGEGIGSDRPGYRARTSDQIHTPARAEEAFW